MNCAKLSLVRAKVCPIQLEEVDARLSLGLGLQEVMNDLHSGLPGLGRVGYGHTRLIQELSKFSHHALGVKTELSVTTLHPTPEGIGQCILAG